MKAFSNFILLLLISVFIVACRSDKKDNAKEASVSEIQHKWKTYRGANVGCDVSEKDVKDLASSGANFMRFSTAVCTFIQLEPPYNYNETAFQKLDSVLDWGEKYGVDVLIDPHRYPGSMHKWTMLGNDPFFKDFKYHDILIKFWKKLAKQCASRSHVVAGYDLLNEPQVDVDMPVNTPKDINLLYKKLTTAIREVDTSHTIVYALPRIYDEKTKVMQGYHKGIEITDIPLDDNICFETHTYMPVPFTHQNIWEAGEYVSYPTTIDSITWDRAYLEKEQKELIAFSQKYPNIPILVGEFSSPRWTGQDGIRYLTDVIEIAEKHNWSWAYHAFRENQVWDPEMNITNRNDSTRIANAPRWELLKSYFKNNKK